MQVKTVVGSVVVAGFAVALTSTMPASADLVTRCVGTGNAVTVPGDLVVPAGQSCSLKGTTVEGRVRVQTGADLVVVDGTLKAGVVVAKDGYLDSIDTSITGTVTSRDAYGVYLEGSQVTGDYRGRAAADSNSFAYLVDSGVGGAVDVRAGELFLDTSRVSGAVRGVGTAYTDVVNSTLSGALTVRDNAEGTSICGSEVDGNTRYTGNDRVQVGTGDLIGGCDDGDVNYFGGNVVISDNTGGVTMNGNIVRGNLAGTDNDPAPTGADNRVRGTIAGQFADLAPTPDTQAQARARSLDTQADPSAEAKTKVQQRRAAALKDARTAGQATL